jgi:serine/threonine protein kinase/tetratricopeptide (TPR) repeat protein
MTSDLQDLLQRALGSAYRIDREIGVGGMATVFAAVETSLNRLVAIKVLQPELAAELSTDRFAREVRLAASLQQANIVPLLSAGEAGGFSYYTMPLVEGSSLRARIASGVACSPSEAISILKDVARALAYAHHAGIVHRDIKPDNILLSGGTAVVSDFGIAKAMDIARASGSADYTLTSPGSSLGTPSYMAPEQVVGDQVDHRADIYAWGVVAWELLAGRHPFADRTTRQAMITAHLTEPPPPLHEHARAVPPSVVALVMASMHKDPDRRPQSATELLAGLEGVATPSGPVPTAPRPTRRIAAGLGVVAILAVAALALPRFFSENASVPPASTDTTPSVAVLPFENIGGDTAQEYFADGMTDELATALGRLPGLRIAARSAAYRYKARRDIDVKRVGSELGVRYLLLGSVRRSGNQLRVSAQLTDSEDAVEIWSDVYSYAANDVLSLQDSLTSAITSALADRLGTVGSFTPSTASRRGTTNNEAYDLYLKGNYYLNRRRPGLEGAARSFEAAIKADPGFGRAYAGLASTLALLSYFSSERIANRVSRATTNAERALDIDSTLAEARVALGILHMTINEFERSDAELRHAIALEPNNAAAHFQLGRALIYRGRIQESIDEFERAKSIEPYQATFACWLGFALARPPTVDRAIAEATRGWELDSLAAVVQNFTALTAIETGRINEARRIAEWIPRTAFNQGLVAWIFGAADSLAPVRETIRVIEARGGTLWLDQMNMSYAALAAGDTTRALAAMETALERQEPVASVFPLWWRGYDPIRSSARFRAVLRRLALDEATLQTARRSAP